MNNPDHIPGLKYLNFLCGSEIQDGKNSDPGLKKNRIRDGKN
jgi:hypothetical protein